MILSIRQKQIIFYCNAASSIFSILGCSFILTMYMSFPSLRSMPFRIITILSIIDSFCSFGYLLPTYNSKSHDSLCLTQSILLNFFSTASILWTSFIALFLYLAIVRSINYLGRYLSKILLLILIISLVTTIIPLLSDTYGTVTGWCWIRQTNGTYDANFYERYLLFFVPTVVLIVVDCIMYVLVSRSLKGADKMQKRLNKRLKLYPIVLILCYLPYLIKSSLEAVKNKEVYEYDFEVTIVVGVVRAGNGLLNSIVYGFTKKVKMTLMGRNSTGMTDSEISKDRGLLRSKSLFGTQCAILKTSNASSNIDEI